MNGGTETPLVERMRGLEVDHTPDGWPAVRMREISELCDEIERLQAKLAEAQKDARRLDWLEAMKSHTNAIDLCVYWRFSGRAFGGIREAVDAAIAAQENTDD